MHTCTRLVRGVEEGERQQSIRNNGKQEEKTQKLEPRRLKTKKTSKKTKIKIQIIKHMPRKIKKTEKRAPTYIPLPYYTEDTAYHGAPPLPQVLQTRDKAGRDKGRQAKKRPDSHGGRAIARCQTPGIFSRASLLTLGDLSPLQREGARGRQKRQREGRISSAGKFVDCGETGGEGGKGSER